MSKTANIVENLSIRQAVKLLHEAERRMQPPGNWTKGWMELAADLFPASYALWKMGERPKYADVLESLGPIVYSMQFGEFIEGYRSPSNNDPFKLDVLIRKRWVVVHPEYLMYVIEQERPR